MKKCIILANGKPPQKSAVDYLKRKNYSILICADGGADSARKLKLFPDYIIGDLDSISNSTLEIFKPGATVIKIKRQNDTDVEKCLKFAIRNNFKEAVLMGVTGDRLDHTFCNLGIVIKFFNKIDIKIVADNSILTPYTGDIELRTVPNETVSLYGFNKLTKIISKGLKFPLKNISLPFGEKESTSNTALSNSIKLHIKGGIIFVIRDFNTIKKYGLL